MATYTLSGGNSLSGYNMGFFGGVAGDIIGIVSNVFSTSHSATHVTYDDGQGTILTINGTFTGFDANGDPTAGTATSFSLTTTAFQSPPPGVPTTITGTGLSIAVPTLIGWITTNNTLALQSAMFDGDDIMTGGAAPEVIHGYGGNDTIDGGDGNDRLVGLAGNDTLNGGAGADEIEGGVGNDTLNGGDGDDRFTNFQGVATGVDSIDGGAGSDRIELSLTTGNVSASNADMNTDTGVTFSDGTFVRNVEIVEFFTGAGNDTLTVSSTGAAVTRFYAGTGIDTLVGEFSQATFEVRLNPSRPGFVGLFTGAGLLDLVDRYVITSGSAADTLVGWSLDDTLSGGGGNDDLEGADGNDTLSGGDGDDLLFGGSVNFGGGGNDVLDGGAGNDTLIDSVGTNTLLGGDGNDIIQGTNADTIDGGAGFDRLRLDLSALTTSVAVSTSPLGFSVTGTTINAVNMESADLTSGSGNDTYSVSGFTSGEFLFDGGAGVDLLNVDFSTALDDLRISYFSVSYFGPSFNLHLFAPNVEKLVATGGAGNDELFGGALGDILNGGAGNDRLNAGDGADQVNGGAGNDLVERYGIGSTIDGGAGLDTAYLSGNELSTPLVFNFDQYRTAAGGDFAGSLLRNFENFIAFGGPVDNTYNFATLAGSISIAGGFGLDRINMDLSLVAGPINVQGNGDTVGVSGQSSGSVNASLIDVISVLGGGGNDFMRGIAGVNVLSGGGGHDDIAGGASGDTLTGDAGNDTLSGGAGNDTISGGLDADTLDGGTGADALIGGTGNDTYFVDTEMDIITELAGEGIDSVSASVTYFLFDEVENLTLAGTAATNGSGNALANVITGNGAANALFGLAGDDTLVGGGGADMMGGGGGVDTASYAASLAGVTINLNAATGSGAGGDAEGDTLVSVENVIGSAFADTLIGRDFFANTLSGGDGDDVLSGGTGGADVMNGGNGIDTLDYSLSPNGVDVRLFSGAAAGGAANGDAYSSIENLIGSATKTDTLAGDAGVNQIWGGGGNETITGREGADTLFGEAGNDTLLGGADSDTLTGGVGADTLGGGSQDDLVDYSASDVGVTVNLQTGLGAGGHAQGDVFVSIEDVTGSEFADVIIGKNNVWDNVFDGRGGNDTYTGGLGNDVFVFRAASGADTVTDFSASALSNNDAVQLLGFGANFDTFAEVIATASQVDADTLIDFGAGQTLTLQNVNLASLTSGDFIFG